MRGLGQRAGGVGGSKQNKLKIHTLCPAVAVDSGRVRKMRTLFSVFAEFIFNELPALSPAVRRRSSAASTRNGQLVDTAAADIRVLKPEEDDYAVAAGLHYLHSQPRAKARHNRKAEDEVGAGRSKTLSKYLISTLMVPVQ